MGLSVPLATQALGRRASHLPPHPPSLRRLARSCASGRFLVVLSIFASVALNASAQTHKDSTRYKTHTNDNGMNLALGNVGDPGTRGFKDPAQGQNPRLTVEARGSGVTTGLKAGNVLARSSPAGSTDGWTGIKQNNVPSSTEIVSDAAAGVSGSDSGSEQWYFLAPTDRFAGDLSAAYNGRLSFTLTHSETPASGSVFKAPDVILEASCGYSLQLYGFASKGGSLSVMLNEDAGWIDSRTRRPPGVMDFLGVLSHLSAVKIRGGFYAGAESTRLSGISMTSGKAWYPCCTIDGTVDICQKQPSSYYNPPNVRYYCEGHMYKPVRVLRVLPRFSRRSGGATITVIGENFGLSGSHPIVRVNGKACQKTYFPPQVVRNNYGAIEVSANSNTFLGGGTGSNLVESSNPAGNALVNAYSSATDSMKQQYPEHCWNGMKDDGTDRGYNYGTATAPKYIQQGEIGIDTGGPCFPLHCSSCTQNTHPAGKLAGANWNFGTGIFRQPEAGLLVSGTATTAKLAAGASSETGYYVGMVFTLATTNPVIITAYDGTSQTATLGFAPGTVPAAGLAYKITPFLEYPTAGTMSAALTLAAVGANKGTAAPEGVYAGLIITITAGAGAGESRTIATSSAAGVLTVSPALTTTGITSEYVITSPALKGRCSTSNQITAFESGDCKGRALTAAGKTMSCNSRFPYLKYPAFCPDDAEFTTTLKNMYTEPVTGRLNSALRKRIWSKDGLFSSLDKDHNMVEGITRVTHINPSKTDTSTLTGTLPSKITSIEVEDAVALCGISIDGELGAAGLSILIDDAAGLSADKITTITTDTGLVTAGAYFASRAANAAGWITGQDLLQATSRGFGYVMIDSEIIKVSAATATTLTIATGGRGAFGTPITAHADNTPIYAVSVCRGAVLSFSPASGMKRVSVNYPTGVNPIMPGGAATSAVIAASTTATQVQLMAGSSSVDGYYVGMTITAMTAGGAAQYETRVITDYIGATRMATVSPAWSGIPTALLTYQLSTPYKGFIQTYTSGTQQIIGYGAFTATDAYKGMRIKIVGGAGIGQERLITAYTAATRSITVAPAFTVALGATSQYEIGTVSGSTFDVVSADNAVCDNKNFCTITVASSDEIINNVHVGDVVRRVPAGRTTATSTLINAGVALHVASVPRLFGATFLFDTAATRLITCGSDTAIAVTAASLVSNTLVLTGASVDNVGATAALSTCVPGSVVTVKSGVAHAGAVADALVGPGHHQYLTTFDVAGVLDDADSDVGEFAPYRYIQMGSEIMQITAVADGGVAYDAAGAEVLGSARQSDGYERLTVARGQLGTDVDAHPRGTKATLLPRMAEVTAAMTATSDKVYLATNMDILANNLGTLTNTAGSFLIARPVAAQTGVAASGASVTSSYIKIDDEIMMVTAITTATTATTMEGNEASLTVLRAQAGTLAAPHSAGSMLRVLGCMDGDETGSNCGGSCKPCTASAKEGPSQHDKLICVTPEGVSNISPSGQGANDLPVTVEASPGPKDSPFSVRMNSDMTALIDASVSAVSCISEQNRGFQYGAHDFVWGVHIKARNDNTDVKITDIGVDRNTGETYVVGTMTGAIYIQGKHIHMSKDFLGELEVAPANPTHIALTSTAAPVLTSGSSSVTAFDVAQKLDTTTSTDYEGQVVVLQLDGTNGVEINGCSARAKTIVTATSVLGVTDFKKGGTACLSAALNNADKFHLYKGSAGFIAKFSKDGRPMWLNKLDTAETANAHELVISSVAVDPTSGHHYIVGHFSDGWNGYDDTTTPTVNYYNIDATTRVAGAAVAGTFAALAADTYGQTNTAGVGITYQEGFIMKYTSAGQYVSREAIKGGILATEIAVSNLKVRAFHASTSTTLNTQRPNDPNPTEKTGTSQNDVEYDFGMAAGGAIGGGTELRSSITLALTAAQFYPPSGNALTDSSVTGVNAAMDDWYNGLTITITCGKGMGQSRQIQDYNAATRIAYVQPHWNAETTIPDTTSCYVISGKPSSKIHGEHLISGGIYVTGNIISTVGLTNANREYVCFGQMPDVYRDTSAPSTGIPLCALLTKDNQEVNFITQYDDNLRAYWSRFIYNGDGTDQASGLITAIEVIDDMIYVAGHYGKGASGAVQLRLQNCTFDSTTVSEGPPANQMHSNGATTLKKLCRSQGSSAQGIGLFPVQAVNDMMAAAPSTRVTALQRTNAHDFGILNTVAADYVQLPTVAAATATTGDMYVAAYDASGSLVWYHYTTIANTGTISANQYLIEPTAIASAQPAIGNKPLTGHWKQQSDMSSDEGREQPPLATGAKDVGLTRYDSATIRGGFIYVTGTVKNAVADKYVDFGITKQPIECSRGKSVGVKDSSAAILSKLQNTPCAGMLQSQGLKSDVFMAVYAAKGAARSDTSHSTYGTGRQPEVQYVRRTGGLTTDETVTGITVDDLTGSAYVIGTYQTSAATKYQGSMDGEATYTSTTGADGGYTYSVTREAGVTEYNGDDIFGLYAANRKNSVGCPMQRFAPANEHDERLGLTGLPDCTMYSHAKSATTTTGFVAKFNSNGDELLGGNTNRRKMPSITGKMSISGTCGAPGAVGPPPVAGTDTCQSSLTPCSGGTSNVGEGDKHVFTAPSACSTFSGGCSCVFLDWTTFSKKSDGTLETSTGAGTANTWSGKRIRIVSGKGAGYEGVISGYQSSLATDHVYYTVPAMTVVPDHTSSFVLTDLTPDPQSKIHLSTCAASNDSGCASHDVEWAKTVGLPIGQTAFTRGAHGSVTNFVKNYKGTWKVVGAAGTASTTAVSTPDGDVITLAVADLPADLTTTPTAAYNGYYMYMSTDLMEPFTNIVVGSVVAGTYVKPTNLATAGGTVEVVCRKATVAAADAFALTDITACPTAATTRYMLVSPSATKGVEQLESSSSRQTSSPTAVKMIDGDVYIGGQFKGFDEFAFGLEGVDETVGYRSVGHDTWESYLVKLED